MHLQSIKQQHKHILHTRTKTANNNSDHSYFTHIKARTSFIKLNILYVQTKTTSPNNIIRIHEHSKQQHSPYYTYTKAQIKSQVTANRLCSEKQTQQSATW